MTVHFLVSYKKNYMASLHHRACNSHRSYCTRDRTKGQGSFSRKHVTCGNCMRTNAFIKGQRQ